VDHDRRRILDLKKNLLLSLDMNNNNLTVDNRQLRVNIIRIRKVD